MAFTKRWRSWTVAVFIILTTALAFFGGNQNLAYADVRSSAIREISRVHVPPAFVGEDSLASQIICHVFTQLNELGEPIPFLDPGSACPRDPQCSDGIDNDGDGKVDSADASCHLDFDADNPLSYHPNIDAEDLEPSTNQCSDGVDNDGDGFTDTNDPNCHTDGDPTNASSYSPTIRSESGSLPVCWNGLDDDGDGLIDLNDPGCSSAIDEDETDDSSGGGTPNQCSDGIDNDGDGFTDTNDPNCHTDGDPTNADSYNPNRSENGSLPVCWNGIDDDGDGLIDLDDPGCTSATDDDETDPDTPPQCSDGLDNDGDGLIDLDDPGCSSVGDNDETNLAAPQCSNGVDDDGDGLIDSSDPGCSGDNDNDETDPSSGGGGGGGSGGGGSPVVSSGGSGGGTITGLITSIGFGGTFDAIIDQNTGAPISCDAYLTEFIKFGGNNKVSQVIRLQRVLKEFEGEVGIKTDGVYDQATLAAIHRFQTKYADDILKPWGINQSTGYVFLTTRKKINEIYCRNTKQFPLTAAERAKIEGTRKAIEGGATVSPTQTPNDSYGSSEIGTVSTTTESGFDILLDQLGITDNDTQTAAAIDAVTDPRATSTGDLDGIGQESLWKKIIRVIRRGLSP